MASYQGSIPASWQKAMTVSAPGSYPVPGKITPVTQHINLNVPGAFVGGGGHSVLGANTTNNTVAQNAATSAAQSAQNRLLAGFDTQRQNIYGTANDSAASAGIGLGSSIVDTIHQLTLGQQALDKQNVQNYLAKQQGLQGVLGTVGRGIRSGGVMLGNRNAGSSSASQALAAAYGDIGRRQASQVGNQFAQNQQNIDTAQTEQNYQVGRAPTKVHESIMNTVNGIVIDARNKLAQLDAAMSYASLPQRIAIDQERNKIKSQVMGDLQQYDQQIKSGVAGIHPASEAQNQESAFNLANAGTAPDNAYSYTNEAPGQFQNGPFASQLPIFTTPKKKVA